MKLAYLSKNHANTEIGMVFACGMKLAYLSKNHARNFYLARIRKIYYNIENNYLTFTRLYDIRAHARAIKIMCYHMA